MIKIGQTVMYRRDVCLVKDIVPKFRDDRDYYKLQPLYDESLTIHAPVDVSADIIRPLLSKRDAEALISDIPNIECVEANDKLIETIYKDLFNSGKHEDLVKIIKMAYLRGEAKLEKGLRRSEKDKVYFKKAEEALYNELAVVLKKSVDDTRDYVVGRVESLAVG